MSQYLLLRDNKQSGPYNFDELTAKGLKAYDLIWIEGKSAAWRYPSEVPELKPFAPVVEEQPYDRFYKRQDGSSRKQQETLNTANTNNPSTAGRTTVNTTNSKTTNTPANGTEQPQVKRPSNPVPNRRVVVIMPGGMNREPQWENVSFHETVENTIAQPEKKLHTPDQKITQPEHRPVNTREQSASRTAIPSVAVYDPELVEFKRTPNTPATSRNNKNVIARSKAPKVLAGILVMLTVGGLIGWAAYNYAFTDKQTITPVALPVETVQLPEAHSVFNNESSEALENQVNTAENPLTDEQMIDAANALPVDSAAASMETTVKKPANKTRKAGNPVNQVAQQDIKAPVSEIAQQANTETQVTNTDNDEAEKKTARKNIAELIKVSKSDFKIGAFGGISNLELKVTNTSPYTVDLVVIEVKYLLANKKEFKTENIYFKNLAPGSTATKEAPKSARGIQVNSKVALITSKALGMYQASL